MTTDVLALREALEKWSEHYLTSDAADAFQQMDDEAIAALIAAVRAETLEGSGVVSMAAVQKAVGILRDYSHGEECAVYAEDDDLVDVYDDPTNEACDCGLRDLILTLTGALPDVGATALALVATPPTPARERGWARDCYCNAEYPGCTDPDCSCSHHAPPAPALTAARLADAMREQHRPVPYHWSQSGESGTVCAGSIVGLHHRVERWPCDVESAILAALATPPAPEVERCGWEGRCGEVRDHEAHRPCGAGSDGVHHTYGCHPFHRAEPTPEKAP